MRRACPPFLRSRAWVALALLLAAGASAQPAGPDGPRFAVRGFRVVGPNPLGPAETAAILQPFVRSDASMASLQEATAALERAMRARGFRLHFVQVPAQELNDTVVLEVAAATLASVTVEGDEGNDGARTRRALPALREGQTPLFGPLAVQTAIANANPHRQLVVDLREARNPGAVEAVVQVTQKRPWSVGAELSNSGSRETGRDRFVLTASHSNLFDRDHQVAAAYTTSLERTRDVRQLGVAYTVPLYEQGAVAAASYTRSDVVGQFGSFSSTGAGHALRMSYALHRPPQGELRGRWIVALEDRLYRGTEVSGVPLGPDRRALAVALGHAWRSETPARAWEAQVELVANTGAGGHDDLEAYRSEYPGIRTTRWVALRAGAGGLKRLPADWVLGLRGNLQYTPHALIAGEQFGLGGSGSVRGTAVERPIAGDRGVSASVELLTPPLAAGLQGVWFLDAGWIGNVAADGEQRIASDRLVGSGVGLRYSAGALQASAEYARLLVGSRAPLAVNPSAPQRGEDRLYVNVGVRF